MPLTTHHAPVTTHHAPLTRPLRIGITFDVKVEGPSVAELPDDHQEEFDSPATIEAIVAVLRELGHEVEKLGDGRDMLRSIMNRPPDFVFNFAEGEGIARSREARVPAVLEMLGVPYTGSDPLTLAVTLDKDCAKRLVQSEGVAVPRGCIVENLDGRPLKEMDSKGLHFPVIVKPAWEGSSKGIRLKSLVKEVRELEQAVQSIGRDHRQPVLVEEFIEGEELTVGVIGNHPPRIIGVMQVIPNQPDPDFIYCLEVKRDYLRRVRYECPAQLPSEVLNRVEDAALAVYRVLGCRDVARVDFRLRGGVPYFLEVNPLPGLNPESSDLVILAKRVGWSYGQLIETILQVALDRQQIGSTPSIPRRYHID
jgi:D-alanine-D-alanine ligase